MKCKNRYKKVPHYVVGNILHLCLDRLDNRVDRSILVRDLRRYISFLVDSCKGRDNSSHDRPNCWDSPRRRDIRVDDTNGMDRLHNARDRNTAVGAETPDKRRSFRKFQTRKDSYIGG